MRREVSAKPYSENMQKRECRSGETSGKGRHLVTAKYISMKASGTHIKALKVYYLWKERIEARFL